MPAKVVRSGLFANNARLARLAKVLNCGPTNDKNIEDRKRYSQDAKFVIWREEVDNTLDEVLLTRALSLAQPMKAIYTNKKHKKQQCNASADTSNPSLCRFSIVIDIAKKVALGIHNLFPQNTGIEPQRRQSIIKTGLDTSLRLLLLLARRRSISANGKRALGGQSLLPNPPVSIDHGMVQEERRIARRSIHIVHHVAANSVVSEPVHTQEQALLHAIKGSIRLAGLDITCCDLRRRLLVAAPGETVY